MFKNISFYIINDLPRAKRRVVLSVNYKIEDSYITHQQKKSDNVEEDCLGGIYK